jgi:hypothetical protein
MEIKMTSRFISVSTAILLITPLFFSCKDSGTTEPSDSRDTVHFPIGVRKPNIYLYPETKERISVRLEFPLGGTLTESDPVYGSGWLVDVEPTGRIDGRYDYLFYEARIPDLYQYSAGWVVHRDTISAFFVHTMAQAGFTTREITDFIDYWGPRLTSDSLYEVYPQQAPEIGRLIRLQVNPAPQNQLRLFFVIRPCHVNEVHLTTPVLAKANRNGYHLAEWGVSMD